MRQTTEIFIPIPKTRNTHCKVEIDGDDLTGKTVESKWVLPVTNGIGTFSLKISNAAGQLSGTYSAGNVVKFYADNTDNSTLQFWGRIDYIKDNVGKNGQFLEIEGRHRSYLLSEQLICYSANGKTSSDILKAIIDEMPSAYGFTYDNVVATTDSMNVRWEYKPFWDCVAEICKFAGYDCYVDDNLDFHYFEENSVSNTTDAVVEGDNLLDSKNWGTNDYYEKTRVTVIGQNGEGIPVVYTAISPSETEIREILVRDTSIDSMAKAEDLATSELARITNRNIQANIKSYGLETVNPGDNIWILIPRQEIHGQYKVIQLVHSFGMKIGGWRTECVIEEEESGFTQIVQSLNQKSNRLIQAENVNKFNYSWNFDFDDDVGSHTSTEITDGVLKTDGSASGTWESDVRRVSDDIASVGMVVKGVELNNIKFFVSFDGGLIYTQMGTQDTEVVSGRDLRIKIEISSASTQIYSLALLFK